MKREPDTRLKSVVLPVLKMTLVVIVAGTLSVLVMIQYRSVPQLAVLEKNGSVWHLYLIRIPEILLSFPLIFLLSKGNWRRYGFTIRSRDLMLKASFLWGIGFASIALINVLLSPPPPPTLISLISSLFLNLVYISIVEEVFFQGLVQTFLMERLKGEVALFKWKFHKGVLWAALLYSVWHFINFIMFGGLIFTLILLIIVFIQGLIQGYIYQRSGSLAGPVIIHSLLNGLPILIVYIYVFLK